MIEVKKDVKISAATVIKQRSGKTGRVWAFRLRPVELGFDEDALPVTDCVLEWTDVPASATKGKKLSENQIALIEALDTAIKAKGQNDFERGAVVVGVEAWREEFEKRSEKTGDAMRQAWKRRKDALPGVVELGGMAWVENDKAKPFLITHDPQPI
jgi:hypothetical protein